MTRLEAMRKLLSNQEMQITPIRAGTRSGESKQQATAPNSETYHPLMFGKFSDDPVRAFRRSAGGRGE
jgi:hypothetical protein